jgi:hypothetical protein
VTSSSKATRNDPRVTAIGKVLRSTSIDELPQGVQCLAGRHVVDWAATDTLCNNELTKFVTQFFELTTKVNLLCKIAWN